MVVQVAVERSKMFCERSEPTLYAAPTCTTIEGPVYVYSLYSTTVLEESTPGLLCIPFVSACVQWELKNY